MYQVSCEEELSTIPLMLSGDALIYYSSNIQVCSSYDEAVNVLLTWYNSSDNRARILTK